MELYDALLTTRAMRRYSDEPVTDEEVVHCLRAAQQAPSGGNLQPWQYLVVTDPALRAEVGALYLAAYDRYERTLARGDAALPHRPRTRRRGSAARAASRHLADHFGEAPAIVLFLVPIIDWTPSDEEGPMDIGPLHASVYPAVQNFMLAARDLGIGTAFTTVVRIRQDELRDPARHPRDDGGRGRRPDGSPDWAVRVARRKPVHAVTHWDQFGTKRSDTEPVA